jgi:hypothetical protein
MLQTAQQHSRWQSLSCMIQLQKQQQQLWVEDRTAIQQLSVIILHVAGAQAAAAALGCSDLQLFSGSQC